MGNENIKISEVVKVEKLTHEQRCCQHRRLLLHVSERAVQCQDCKAYIDAFDYLLKYANEFFARTGRIKKETGEEIKRLAAEKENLKREIRNLKSQIIRAKKKMEST